MANIDKDPTKGLNAAVAAELRAERVAQEVAFDDLVERVSLSRATTWRLLNAERLITIEALAEFAGALGVSVLEIVERAEKRLARKAPPPPPRRGGRRAPAMASPPRDTERPPPSRWGPQCCWRLATRGDATFRWEYWGKSVSRKHCYPTAILGVVSRHGSAVFCRSWGSRPAVL